MVSPTAELKKMWWRGRILAFFATRKIGAGSEGTTLFIGAWALSRHMISVRVSPPNSETSLWDLGFIQQLYMVSLPVRNC